ncbi:Protein of unknown function [Gryllus bimaculatus]|nr:Protein of unknown function [Gryllus bimaculatus]
MSKRVLSNALPEVLRSISTCQTARFKMGCYSQIHSKAATLGTEIDLQKKTKRQDVTKLYPKLSDRVIKGLETVSSFHITNSAISWAKMSCTRKLLEWEVKQIVQETDKVHLMTVYKTILQITNCLPKSNVYVLEEMSKSRQSTSGAFIANVSMLQFRAILLAFLNGFEIPSEGSEEGFNKVYFLQFQVAARLSSTLVGREKVAVEQTVMNIVNIPGHTGTCPQYSPIDVDWTLKQKYLSQESVEKENMGQALLLVMAFMDLLISKRQQSINHIRKIN